MAAGAPVVATAVSGIPELVEHEVNGLLVAPDDPQALADALRAPARRPRARRAGSPRNGRATVRERFDGDAPRGAARRRCSGRRSRVSASPSTPPAPGALRQRARAPRPRARRRASLAGRFTFAGETRELGARARLAAAPPARRTRSGGSTGSSSTYGLDLADAVPRHRRPRATSTRGSGSSRASIGAGPAGPRRRRGHRPPDPELDLRLAAAAARPDAGWRTALRREPRATQVAHVRAQPRRRSATTARSSSTRC